MTNFLNEPIQNHDASVSEEKPEYETSHIDKKFDGQTSPALPSVINDGFSPPQNVPHPVPTSNWQQAFAAAVTAFEGLGEIEQKLEEQSRKTQLAAMASAYTVYFHFVAIRLLSAPSIAPRSRI